MKVLRWIARICSILYLSSGLMMLLLGGLEGMAAGIKAVWPFLLTTGGMALFILPWFYEKIGGILIIAAGIVFGIFIAFLPPHKNIAVGAALGAIIGAPGVIYLVTGLLAAKQKPAAPAG